MKHILTTVWSGGQYGVDIAALAAAKDCGLMTGGFIPLGFKTKYGTRPELAKLGLVEHKSPHYSPRTYDNIKYTDGTLILAYDFNSPGTCLTKKGVAFYSKPSFEVDLKDPTFFFDVTDWIDNNNIVVLNVAGNSGKTKAESSLIFQQARHYLNNVFKTYKGE